MITKPITIRLATPADNGLLAELGERTFANTFGPDNTPEDMAAYLAASFTPQRLSQKLANPNTFFLIAEMDSGVVGYAELELGPPPVAIQSQRPIQIDRIYADIPWIGKGVGSALMQACLQLARAQNCDAVWLSVWERNPHAVAFYRRWGFEVAGDLTFKLGSDLQHDFLMVRNVVEQ